MVTQQKPDPIKPIEPQIPLHYEELSALPVIIGSLITLVVIGVAVRIAYILGQASQVCPLP